MDYIQSHWALARCLNETKHNLYIMNTMLRSLFFLYLVTQSILAIGADIIYKGIYYNINHKSQTLKVVGVSDMNISGELTIPDTIKYAGVKYPVNEILDQSFKDCKYIEFIQLPKTITIIGKGAFEGCLGLTSINLPEGITEIPERAFYNCSGLTSLTIPKGMTSIGDLAFGGCSGLTSLIIPESVTSIGNRLFQDCIGLTSVMIPDGVTSIGEMAFENCI